MSTNQKQIFQHSNESKEGDEKCHSKNIFSGDLAISSTQKGDSHKQVESADDKYSFMCDIIYFYRYS